MPTYTLKGIKVAAYLSRGTDAFVANLYADKKLITMIENDGQGGPGWKIDAGFNEVPHTRGVLSMARSKDPNSAGSQFFICVADAPHLDGDYTAFGEVIDKVHIIDHIVHKPKAESAKILKDFRNMLNLHLQDRLFF